jgi:HD-GYP domain-containing protein (c-di-GMP phosphodiesterase class II)
MFVDGMDAEWQDTPFLVHKFLIKDHSQIEKLIGTGISHVFIDTEKGLTQSGNEAQTQPGKAHDTVLGEQKPSDVQLDGVQYTLEELQDYYKLITKLTHIDRETLVKGTVIDFSLYLKRALKINRIAVYIDKSIELTPQILNFKGEFMIKREDNGKYKGYLRELIQNCGSGLDKAALMVRSRVIKENSKLLIQDLFDDPRSGETIKGCKVAVEDIIGSIQDNRQLTSEMLTINKYDHYTYTHSVNVSVLSLGMAMELGMKDEELRILGMGGLLHDVGKSKIPPAILNKPGRLDDREFAIIKQHVMMGKKLLASNVEIPQDALLPLLHHHEKLNGKGYPHGLKDSQISITGRITAIADTYDALTTARPYKNAFTPFEALATIRDQISGYDAAIFQKFVKMLGGLM